ncbi:M14 family zinc carboxypeptidase [bacterium]|nr:M14 family zinc carboxypeptidase [bacterium]
MKYILFTFLIWLTLSVSAQINYKYQNSLSFSYSETIENYKILDSLYANARLVEMGKSDIGRPIHLFIISEEADFSPASIHNKGNTILLINNGIHPGEPCGIDASLKFAEDLLSSEKKLLKNTTVCIIPFYNIGGGLNRSCCSRAMQNGPQEYGFRGNAQNRDLNRDFIKCDSENAKAFTKIYHQWNPEVFVDCHTTNGSDFQYGMSIIATQKDKLNKRVSDYLNNEMLPFLYKDMVSKNMEIIPYVYNVGNSPDNGIKDYLETPRYSTGFTTLFNSIGFVTEALKYKKYSERVEQTYAFLHSTLTWMHENSAGIIATKQLADAGVKQQKTFPISWERDTITHQIIDFKGYEVEEVESAFGKNAKKTIYNRDKPYTKKIKYFNKFNADIIVEKPIAYIVPQAYKEVVERLRLNQIEMVEIKNDTSVTAEVYYIKDYETVKTPYEGHYLHYDVEVIKKIAPIDYYKGDFIVYTNQASNRYIIETLEPQGVDSYFAWNFFDGILQQKEWFSPFSFEDEAVRLLKEDSKLKVEFQNKMKSDENFAMSQWDQLYFIYQRSPYYEKTHNRYPVARLIKW